MTTVLALPVLYEDVKARALIESPGTSIQFGWKKPSQQLAQGTGRANRVCFVPGEGKSVGSFGPAKAPGRNGRPLRTLFESCTVYCWAVDATSATTLNDELAQYTAARLLSDAVVRWIELAMRKTSIKNLTAQPYSKPEWVVEANRERMFGAELKFVLTVEAMIPDELPNLGGSEIIEVELEPGIGVELSPAIDVPGEDDPPTLTGDGTET